MDETTENIALHVALQTLKDRCKTLQTRLTAIEEENALLRQNAFDKSSLNLSGDEEPANPGGDGSDEVRSLRDKIKDLGRQKMQLSEHIAMVAAENRQLWSRLSKLTKDNQSLGYAASASAVDGAPNLIRSKTFTKNAPNPKLRENCKEISSPEGDEAAAVDLTQEVRRCTDEMEAMKREVLRQQSDLKVALSNLRRRRAAAKSTEKVEEETEEVTEVVKETPPVPPPAPKRIDFIEEKRRADSLDKICPMCGRIFAPETVFEEFQEHVESHFIDENDSDVSIERHFEIISQSVGNF